MARYARSKGALKMEKTIDYSSTKIVWSAPKMHKGTAYFPSYAAARTVRDARLYPAARIIEYEIGYAIQYWISGPYYPEHEF